MPWSNVAALKSSAVPGPFVTELFDEPTGTIARSMPRYLANGAGGGTPSGTVSLRQMILPQGLTVSSMSMTTGTTAKTGGTHGWYVLLTSAAVVLSVTADQTDAATVWGATTTAYPLAFTAPAVMPYTGVYYAGVMVANSAGTQPTFVGVSAIAPGLNTAPFVTATSSTGQTTPPAVGATLAAIVAAASPNPYVGLS